MQWSSVNAWGLTFAYSKNEKSMQNIKEILHKEKEVSVAQLQALGL